MIVGAVFCVSAYVRHKRRRDDSLSQNLRWASTYKDNPTSEFNLHSISGRRTSDRYAANEHASSTDPFATHLAPNTAAEAKEDEQPQVYIGPPRDEDGHVLHSVEIL